MPVVLHKNLMTILVSEPVLAFSGGDEFENT
jgi:hypothetical protein